MREPIRMSELERRLADPATDLDELAPYLKPDPARSEPFKPAFTINEEMVIPDRARLLGLDLDSWNARGARRRQEAYERRIVEQPNQTRLLAEGDSWFQFPLGPPWGLADVLVNLMPHYAIYDVSAAGDTFENMSAGLDKLETLIAEKKPRGFLFSAGGNDIAGPQFEGYVKGHDPGFAPADYLSVNFAHFLHAIEGKYNTLLSRLTRTFPDLKIFCNGYDWAIPRSSGRFGVWLWPSFELRGVPPETRPKIVAAMIDRFNEMLERQAGLFDGKVIHVDCRGIVTETRWFDELHPNDAGFVDVAKKFRTAIEKAFGGQV